MFSTFQGIGIAGTGHALPRTAVPNSDLGLSSEKDEWVRRAIGVESRKIIQFGESTTTLAVSAAERALESASIRGADLDAIIVATSTPTLGAPSTACAVQAVVGMRPEGAAFDLQAVCSGFVYACNVAASLLTTSDASKVLVIGADAFSTVTDWRRRDRFFFGDAAGALVLMRSPSLETKSLSFLLHSDGEDSPSFSIGPAGATFQMNADAVYRHATKVLPVAIKELLHRLSLSIHDVDFIVPHQPSLRVLEALAKSLDISENIVLKGMRESANTAAASIPLLLSQSIESNTIARGDKLVLAAVGSGWTWGAATLDY